MKSVIQSWAGIISSSLQVLWGGFLEFLPSFLGAIIVFVVGWAIAALLGRLAGQIITTLRIDHVLEKMGLKKRMEGAGLKFNTGVFVGELVRWFFIIVFLMAATDILGLSQVTEFLKQIILYVPHLIVAVVILLAAVVMANFLQRFIQTSIGATGLGSANVLGAVAKWGLLVFAVLAALLQLGIASALIQTIFTGLVAAFTLAFGLAFGLGGKAAAAEYLSKISKKL